MRPDDAHSTRIDQKLPPLPEGELLTAAQLTFAQMLGRILAERWAALRQLGTAAPPSTPDNDPQTDPRAI